MSEKEKYVNKFHEFKFNTDSEKDIAMNIPPLSKDIEHERISDDFSNEIQIQYEYSKEPEYEKK